MKTLDLTLDVLPLLKIFAYNFRYFISLFSLIPVLLFVFFPLLIPLFLTSVNLFRSLRRSRKFTTLNLNERNSHTFFFTSFLFFFLHFCLRWNAKLIEEREKKWKKRRRLINSKRWPGIGLNVSPIYPWAKKREEGEKQGKKKVKIMKKATRILICKLRIPLRKGILK